MTSTMKPTILLLSLNKQPWFDDVFSGLLKALATRATVIEAMSLPIPRLSLSIYSAVFITDEALTDRKHMKVLSQAIDYARGGGIVVIGGLFSSFAKLTDFDSHFLTWGVPWKAAGYRRSMCMLDRATHPGFRSNARLPASYSMKAVSLQCVPLGDIVYKRHESDVIDKTDEDPSSLLKEATVTYTRLGSGYLGYIGDVNAEQDSTSVALAMCGLPV